MKKILVPIDFSETTQSACDYALNLLDGQVELLLFHAYFDQVVASDSGFPAGVDTETMVSEQLLHDIKLRAKKDLVDLQASLYSMAVSRKITDIKIDTLLEGGEPTNEILRVSENYQPDFIVMGTSGGNKKGFLEGSVARKIMDQSEVPVFAIPYLEKISWPNEIMYATEFSDEDAKMIRRILSLLSFLNPRISCLHILQKEEFDNAKEKLDKLRDELSDEEREGQVQFFIQEETDLKENIASFLVTHDISLMSFIPHKRGFIKSLFTHKLTKKELFQFNLPLLAIK
jgi:nucleotide-binding universal stress UspA family protein